MRRTLTTALLTALTLSVALAQTDKKKYMTPGTGGSDPKMASATVNGKEIWIAYHAPKVKGRKIFGDSGAIVPNNSVWRAGADQATFLHTDVALDFGGKMVPAGEYTLWVATNAGKWDLVVNKQTGQWGTQYNQGQDLVRIPMTMGKTAAPVEEMKYTVTASGGKGSIKIEWADTSATANFTAK